MNFICNRETINKEIASASKIIASKNSITSISNVILTLKDSTLTIKATDAKIWFETQIAVTAFENGEIAINCDKFSNIIKALPQGDISFKTEEQLLVIKSVEKSSIDISLRYQNSEGFPLISNAEESAFFRLAQKDFLKMSRQTSFAVSKEETRVFVNGVFMEYKNEHLVMVATDAKRLSLIEMTMEKAPTVFEGVIIPPKFLDLIKNLACGEGEIALAIVDKTIYAHFDNLKITAVLIEGRFPNYTKVIPEKLTHQLTFSTSDFIDALRRVSLMTDPKLNRIFVTFEENKAILKSINSDVGEIREEVAAEYLLLDSDFKGSSLKEEGVTLALNHLFISEPLQVMGDKNFCFRFTGDASRPIALHPSNDTSFFHIIMPMQLD